MVKKIYVAKGCPACVEAKKKLRGAKGIKYVDVEKHPEQAGHIVGTPTLENEDGSTCIGVDEVVACARRKK